MALLVCFFSSSQPTFPSSHMSDGFVKFVDSFSATVLESFISEETRVCHLPHSYNAALWAPLAEQSFLVIDSTFLLPEGMLNSCWLEILSAFPPHFLPAWYWNIPLFLFTSQTKLISVVTKVDCKTSLFFFLCSCAVGVKVKFVWCKYVLRNCHFNAVFYFYSC